METSIILSAVAIIAILLLWISRLKKTIQELTITKNQLQYETDHDTLTGLANGTLFMDRLNQSMKNAKRYKKKIAVLYLNVDHFKKVNDSLGTNIGDELLQALAKKLVNNLRQSDTVSRIGGDEFIIILDHFEDASFVTLVVDKVMQLSRRAFTIQENEINITFSIGVSIYPDTDTDSKALLETASIAMRNVKESSRDGYKIHT